jgi:hypothetical protein
MYFHYDYFSLKDIDIEAWYNDFFWPVSRETGTQLMLDFKAEQARMINKLGHTFEGDCFLIGHLISHEFVQIIYCFLLLTRLQADAKKIKYSGNVTLLPKMFAQDRFNFEYYKLAGAQRNGHLIESFKFLILELKYNAERHRFKCFNHFNANGPVYSFCSPNVIDRKYSRGLEEWIRFTFFDEWLQADSPRRLETNEVKILSEISEAYLNFAVQYVHSRFGMTLPDQLKKGLYRHAFEYLCHIGRQYKKILSQVAKKRPRHLLSATAGQPFVRALSLAVRKEGGKSPASPTAITFVIIQAPARHCMKWRRSMNSLLIPPVVWN